MRPEELDKQERALIERVQRQALARCESVEEEARRQRNELLEQGRKEARARMRQAMRQERSRSQQAQLQAQAQADLQQRQREQAQLQQVLAAMWKELPQLLEARWQDPAQQRAWVEAALESAAALLPRRAWTLELASALGQEARAALEARARKLGATEVKWVQDPALGPGVRIRAKGACLSATIPGLLARRADIEADFLALYLAPSTAEAHGSEAGTSVKNPLPATGPTEPRS